MSTDKVSSEVAQADLERVIDALGLDIDVSSMTEAEQKSHQDTMNKLRKAIQSGQLSVDDDGRFVGQLGGQQITFHHPTGSTFMALDKRKEDIGRVVAVLQDITKKDGVFFAKLPAREFKLCTTIVSLFLG